MFPDSMDLYSQAVCVVYLSNGEIMYINTPSAWQSIGIYILNNNLSIDNLALRFRSHWENPVEPNCDGYYLGIGFQGGLDANEGAQSGMFVVGTLSDGIIRVREWRVPELVPVFEEPSIRDFQNSEGKLIINVAKTNKEEQSTV